MRVAPSMYRFVLSYEIFGEQDLYSAERSGWVDWMDGDTNG